MIADLTSLILAEQTVASSLTSELPAFFLVLLAAYVLGSIPFGVIVGKRRYGVDVRQYGSGNIGATNILRILGPLAALLVFAADLLKGAAAVWLATYALGGFPELMPYAPLAAGLAAIVGHSYSIFLGFSGGKGVTTAAGVVLASWWWVVFVLLAVWGLVLALSKYVSLASLSAAIMLPVLIALVYQEPLQVVFTAGMVAVIWIRHKENIKRLLAGRELRIGQRVGGREQVG